MRMFDSNIVIYSTKAEFAGLDLLAGDDPPIVCAVSLVEVLGYRGLTEQDEAAFERIFSNAEVLPITNVVIDRAIALRRTKRIKLGDALIAATALVHSLELVTRNTDDFAGIPGLVCINPIPDPSP